MRQLASVFAMVATIGMTVPAMAQPSQPTQPTQPGPAAKQPGKQAPLQKGKPGGKQSAERDAALDAITAAAFASGNVVQMQSSLEKLLDERIAYAPLASHELFIGPAQWLRMTKLLEESGPAGGALLQRLKDYQAFAAELAFLRKSKDDAKKVVALANRLISQRADDVKQFPALAAAICVVFDEERTWELGKGPDALDAFDYFVKNDSKLVMSTRDTPAELLVFVVDTFVPAAQLEWARSRYNAGTRFAKCFSDVPYDYDNFSGGKPLKISKVDPTLENILKVGGVCRHQAFYGANIAKAYGVPSICIVGWGSEVGHMWLGYLEVTPRTAKWNLDAGRFGEYEDMTGHASDPQTGDSLSDGDMSLLARASLVPAIDRRYAAAITDAADRLSVAGESGEYPPPPPPPADLPTTENEKPSTKPGDKGGEKVAEKGPVKARAASVETRLAMLDAAVAACPAHAEPWEAISRMAKRKELKREDINHWADQVITLCAQDFPDFAVDTLAPMISSVEDPDDQDKLWSWAFDQFSGVGKSLSGKGKGKAPRRPDLAARIRFSQAAMWDTADAPEKAWDDYMDVINRFPNDGNHIVSATSRCEKLLTKQKKPLADAVKMYASAWGHVKKPPASMSPEFMMASNWVRIGMRYASLLEASGDTKKSAEVWKQMPVRVDVTKRGK